MKKTVAGVILFLVVTSCSYFKQEVEPEAIARAAESFLYESDIIDLVPPGSSKEDSISIVRNYIDRSSSES